MLIMSHPTPWEFHPVHHPSYIDFFEQVLAETTDPIEIEAELREAVRRGRVVPPPLPHELRLPRRPPVLHVVLGRARAAAPRPRDHRRRRARGRSAASASSPRPRSTTRSRWPPTSSAAQPDDHPPPQPADPHGRRPVSQGKRARPSRGERSADQGQGARRVRPQPAPERAPAAEARGVPAGAHPRCPAPSSPSRPSVAPASTTTPTGPARPVARAARRVLLEGRGPPARASASPTPRSRGLDRLDGLDGPVIFAANHHSHLDTPLLLTSLPGAVPPPGLRRRRGRLLLRQPVQRRRLRARPQRHPDRAHQGQPPLRRPGGRAPRRRLVDGHLPRGRPLPRRVGPALPGRRRLPRGALRRAGRARAPRGHRSAAAEGGQAPAQREHPGHLRGPARPEAR